MSFILDALKKVDRKKDDHAQDGVVLQGGRRWGDTRFPWALTAVVLVAIAALALATVALFRSFPGEEAGKAGGVESAREQAAVSAGQAPLPSSVAVPAEGDATSSDDVASPEPANSVDSAEQVETAETVEVVETMPIEDEAAGLDEMEEPITAPPVTLVGRASEDLVAPEAPDGDDGADGTDEQPPSELPPLVLQGTSVIDGKPVAVVNYQRLSEGDVIEGARVVKILDRAVELEFKGRRFTIRL